MASDNPARCAKCGRFMLEIPEGEHLDTFTYACRNQHKEARNGE